MSLKAEWGGAELPEITEDDASAAALASMQANGHDPTPPEWLHEQDGEPVKKVGWPSPIDWPKLAERDPLPPAFIIPDWLPCGYATLLAGHGGVGKSGIALHLAICIATGTPWWGLECAQRKVLYLSCEDRENVIHWRTKRICEHLDLGLGDLTELSVLDLVGHDSILWEPSRGGIPFIPMPFAELAVLMASHDVVIIDGISDTYGGDEIKRSHVKAFVNALVSLVDADRGAVILVGHVAKPAANSAASDGYSGSTSWHNSVRARWYLYPGKEDEEQPSTNSRKLNLELQKSNLGRADQEIKFQWSDQASIFLGQSTNPQTHFDRRIQEETEREGVLMALRACKIASIRVPTASTGQRTAFHVLSANPQFPASLRSGRPALRRFWKIMEQLRQCRMLTETEYRDASRHFKTEFILTA